jgi:hypothetical protein
MPLSSGPGMADIVAWIIRCQCFVLPSCNPAKKTYFRGG